MDINSIKEGFGRSFYGILRRIFPESFNEEAKNSSSYANLQDQIGLNQLNIDNLETKLSNAEDTMREVQQNLILTEGKFQIVKTEKEGIEADYSKLQIRYVDFKRRAPAIMNQVEEAIKLCRNIRVSKEAMLMRAKANKEGNSALGEWQEKIVGPLEKRLEVAEEKTNALVGAAFGLAVSVANQVDKRSEKVPFAYYDFNARKLYCTPATLKLLDIHEEELEDVNLGTLIKYIRKEDRRKIVNSIELKSALVHYAVKTAGENPRDLFLTTHPFSYNKIIVGVGISLYDPKSMLKRPRGTKKFVKRVENVIDQLSKRFDEIMESSEELGEGRKYAN